MTNDITCPYKNLYTNVHSSTTQNYQNIKNNKDAHQVMGQYTKCGMSMYYIISHKKE